MRALEELSIKENHLTQLPDNIRAITRLKYLDLQKNALSSLPATITDLQVLNHLNLQENPLVNQIAQTEKVLEQLEKRGCTILK